MTTDQTARGMLGLLRGLSARAELSAPVEVDVTRAVLERLRRAPLTRPRRYAAWATLAASVLLVGCGCYWMTTRNRVEPEVGDPMAELLTSAGLHVDLAEPN